MDLHILQIVTFLMVAVVVSQAASPPETYWKKMLPNTAIPKAVKLSLPKPEWVEEKSTTGGSHLHVISRTSLKSRHHHKHHRGHTAHTDVTVDPIRGVGVHTKKHGSGHTDVDVGPMNGVGVHTEKAGKGGADVDVGFGGVTVKAGPKEKPVYVGVHPGPNPFDYNYAHSKDQAQHEPARSLFFLERDMKSGHSMKLHFQKSTNAATFLPREKAESLPFSSNKISAILREFSVEPNSEEANVIEETIAGCKQKGIHGEQKYCATSLESLVDYAKKALGKNVKALSTEAKLIDYNKVRNYTIDLIKKVAGDNEAAVCHKQRYAYAVFYCHKTKDSSAYMVSLISGDRSKANAMAVCHKDTSAWNPKHLAFQALNVRPGSLPICHFLPEDHIVWVSN